MKRYQNTLNSLTRFRNTKIKEVRQQPSSSPSNFRFLDPRHTSEFDFASPHIEPLNRYKQLRDHSYQLSEPMQMPSLGYSQKSSPTSLLRTDMCESHHLPEQPATSNLAAH